MKQLADYETMRQIFILSNNNPKNSECDYMGMAKSFANLELSRIQMELEK